MLDFLLTTLPLAAADGAMFASLKASAADEIAAFHPTVMTLTSIIATFTCIDLCKKVMQGGKDAGVGLFDFLRPLYMFFIIANFSLFSGWLDSTVSLVTDGVSSSLQTKASENKTQMGKVYDRMTDAMGDISSRRARKEAAQTMVDINEFDGDKDEYSEALKETEKMLKKMYRCSIALGGHSIKGLLMMGVDAFTAFIARCFEFLANINLILLGFVGPFVFAFAMLPKFAGGTWGFIERYIEVSFWKVCCCAVMWINVLMKDYYGDKIISIVNGYTSTGKVAGGLDAFGTTMMVINCATIFMIFKCREIASMIINGGGAGGVEAGMVNTAGRAARAAGGAVGRAAGKGVSAAGRAAGKGVAAAGRGAAKGIKKIASKIK